MHTFSAEHADTTGQGFSSLPDQTCDAAAATQALQSLPFIDAPELLDPRIWQYRGEGNANIILSAQVSSAKLIDRFGSPYVTIRLRKVRTASKGAMSTSLSMDSDLDMRSGCPSRCCCGDDHAADPAVNTVAFVHDAIRPLFGSASVPHMALLPVSPDFLTALVESPSMQTRHVSRVHKQIDTMQRHAVLSRDYSRHPGPASTVCLEIKPKWLFVPAEFSLPSSKADADSNACCRFCRHQRYKEQTKAGFQRSLFCPLDLVSGDRKRVAHAVECLMARPQNNLRVWVDGVAVDLAERDAKIVDVVERVVLVIRPLLDKLAEHQRALDGQGMEHVYRLYQDEAVRTRVQQQMQQDPNLWRNVVERYLQQQATDGKDEAQAVLDYLLSMTLKDCSIMATVASADAKDLQVVLLDLDPKPLHKMERWYRLHTQLLQVSCSPTFQME
ncbi:hypothetical protein RI367_003557 [Sorochytrium milnesiophthora]